MTKNDMKTKQSNPNKKLLSFIFIFVLETLLRQGYGGGTIFVVVLERGLEPPRD
ncbi:MAG: hypothetical protein U9Q12_00760 [Patescibacteria group bacterium]|nr:hypothetical protein [Patescibacteria group bacterium]